MATNDRNMVRQAERRKGKGWWKRFATTILARSQGRPSTMNTSSRMEETEVLRIKLEMLRSEHRDLDHAISALQERGSSDMLTIRRLKKQKLFLKDQIAVLEDRILPDIIA